MRGALSHKPRTALSFVVFLVFFNLYWQLCPSLFDGHRLLLVRFIAAIAVLSVTLDLTSRLIAWRFPRLRRPPDPDPLEQSNTQAALAAMPPGTASPIWLVDESNKPVARIDGD